MSALVIVVVGSLRRFFERIMSVVDISMNLNKRH